jgi:hypothetical protein
MNFGLASALLEQGMETGWPTSASVVSDVPRMGIAF